ncbi:MAG: DNA mismatch repair endonuclease MutL, partial [Clostridia bacterium]|nr:DNA mismatch repair endonuclease MutL [Clostridia bacterium]
MGKINVLGFDVANLIAAGEVVDRPASVVKELLENSIDAGATSVTAEIQSGGVALIRVTDNGCGMEPDDLPVAILRHATSKIKTARDLSEIGTLGFRGEALAAIASVSKMRIFSKPAANEMGTLLECEAGRVTSVSEVGCATGTTVVVEDLFFSVPARRKFLKRDATEAAAVSAVVERLALSRPDVEIKFISDGEVKFVTTGSGDLKEAVYSVFGRECANRSIRVDRTDGGVTVTGFISEPDLYKSNRNMEVFFVNGRLVKSRTIMAAVEQAYRSRIPSEKFPVCVLNVDLNLAAVDVNVHPAKLEVKFSDEKVIFDSVYYAVLSALQSETVRPELKFAGTGADVPCEGSPAEVTPKPKNKKDFWIDGEEARRLLNAFVPADTRSPKAEQVKIYDSPPPAKNETPAPATPAARDGDEKRSAITDPGPIDPPEYIILGEAYNCYVIVQFEDRLTFVDKHAAHERIIFDELCRNARKAEKNAQLLMTPIIL